MRFLFKVFLTLGLIILLYFKIKLYHTQSYNNELHYDLDVYAQLQHLKNEMHNKNAARRMQSYYPEGFVFQNALYGLTWCDLLNNQTDLGVRTEALEEIDWAIAELCSEDGILYFQKDLPIPYGIFYQGWTNILIGKRLQIENDSSLLTTFLSYCDTLNSAYTQGNSPYLESYENAIWPADNIIGLAALNLGNTFSTGRYDQTINLWLNNIKANLDKSGRIPHSVSANGRTSQLSRGNSMSLMLCFLKDLDMTFAQEQFESYKSAYVTTRLGLPGIREHAKGIDKSGDIDSGPVIWDIGGAASIVGQRTMAIYEEWNTAEGLRNSIESFGVAYTANGQKKYVFGQVPMADAFIAWSNASTTERDMQPTTNWRWKFQLGSIVLAIILLLTFIKSHHYH